MAKMAEMNTCVNLTMWDVEHQTQGHALVELNKLKFPEYKPFKGSQDAKELKISSSTSKSTLKSRGLV